MNNEKRQQYYFFSTFPGGYAPGVAQSTPPASTTAPNATAKSHPSPHHHSPSDTLATPSSSFSNPPSSSSNTPLSSSPWYTVAEQNSEPHPHPYPLPRTQQARLSPVRWYSPGGVQGLYFDSSGGFCRIRWSMLGQRYWIWHHQGSGGWFGWRIWLRGMDLWGAQWRLFVLSLSWFGRTCLFLFLLEGAEGRRGRMTSERDRRVSWIGSVRQVIHFYFFLLLSGFFWWLRTYKSKNTSRNWICLRFNFYKTFFPSASYITSFFEGLFFLFFCSVDKREERKRTKMKIYHFWTR